jgi:hypothetical protein
VKGLSLRVRDPGASLGCMEEKEGSLERRNEGNPRIEERCVVLGPKGEQV